MSLRVETARARATIELLDSPRWAARCGFVTSPLARAEVLAARASEVTPDGTTTLTVATFNTLRRGYNFDEKDWVPEAARAWAHRLPLVHAIIRSLDADVLALEEAELLHFDEDFSSFLSDEMGYECVHAEMRTAEDRRHDHTKPTLCFRRAMFALVDSMPRSRAVVAELEHKLTGRRFFVAAAHLQGGGGEGGWTRCCQTMKLLRSVEPAIRRYCKDAECEPADVPFVMLGDLNASPDEPVIALLTRETAALTPERLAGTLFEPHAAKLGSFAFPLALVDGLAEATAAGVFPSRPFTFKWGALSRAAREEAFQSIDFVLYSPGPLALVAVRERTTVEHEDALVAGTAGLPSMIHPSDHLPLAMRLELRPLPKRAIAAAAAAPSRVETS